VEAITDFEWPEIRFHRPDCQGRQEGSWISSAREVQYGAEMNQLLLFPDPPVGRAFGSDFFRQAPECAGVYLMRDAAGTVLYVGKAKNLRKRLGSYRVANPIRLRKRHLKLLRVVSRIDLQECADEESALLRESELLRTLRPRFNRAGTWAWPSRFLTWCVTTAGWSSRSAPQWILAMRFMVRSAPAQSAPRHARALAVVQHSS